VKILQIQLLPLLYGAQIVMLRLIKNMPEHEFEVLSLPGEPLASTIKNLGCKHQRITSLRRELSILDIKALYDIYRVCKKGKYDIVHTHSAKTGFLGRIAARLAGIPKIIHTVHGFPFHDFQHPLVRFFYMKLERFAAKFCDQMVFVNQFERQMAIDKRIVPAVKAFTIYNGVQLIDCQKKESKDETFTIGSIGRFCKQKNSINVIKAAIEVCKRNNELKFVFLGDGELLDRCRAMVSEANVDDRIELPGWQRNTEDWLCRFDLFLLFSRWEGLPLSILEAMAAGLPIVASDIKGNNELVSEENGVLLPIDALDKLKETLASITEDREKLQKWGRRSREIVQKKFSIKKCVDEYKRLYEL
jgi:glycosyltransferase involved in cell wall biosynthesis